MRHRRRPSPEIYAAKGRPAFNPLIAHVANLAAAKAQGIFSADALRLAERFWPGPLTLVLPLAADATVCAGARAGRSTIALARPLASRRPAPARRRRSASRGAFGQSLRPDQPRHRGPCLQRSFRRDRSDPRRGALPGRRSNRRSSPVSTGRRACCAPAAFRGRLIEAALGAELAATQDAGVVIAPGALASHYAPHAKLRLDALSLRSRRGGA